MALTIACVLRAGGAFTPEWVGRLQGMVAEHAPPHRFVCLSDQPVPCERVPLEHEWPRWWPKIECFRPGLFQGPVLYLDLDTIVVGSLDEICAAAARYRFLALRDFTREDGIGTGVTGWRDQNEVCAIYRSFTLNPEGWMRAVQGRGDQGFLEELGWGAWTTRWQGVVPGQIVSFKVDGCEAGPPPGARVVCLHGAPKFDELPAESWARQRWLAGESACR